MADDKVIESAVGDIHLPDKNSIDTSFEFTPQNPFTVDIGNEKTSDNIANPGYPVEPEPAGFFESAKEEFKETSTDIKILHAAQMNPPEKPDLMMQHFAPDIGNNFAYKPPPPGWTPKEEIEKLSNIDPKFMPLLLAARNPQDFQYRLNDIYDQQHHDAVLENGSTFGKIMGGLIGYSPIGSIENFIPLATIATKAKVGTGFLNAMMKSFPSMLGASAVREGAVQMDKIDSNLPDFLKDTFVDAAFGTVFFGAIGAGKSLVNVAEFNRIKDFSKKYLEGISFDYVVDEKGNLKGFKAKDMTGGTLSAAKVTKAQELADSAFYKGGLFKIPYVGTASLALLSGNIPGLKYLLGSPLIRLKTSNYKAANAFADSAFDHFITTEGEAKGGTRPPSFEFKVKQTRAMLTALKVQTTALHAERNGYSITARPAIGIQNAWAAMKQKSIEALSQQTKSSEYVGEDEFMDEVQRVLFSEKSSEHASVNAAAGIYRKVIDETYKSYRIAHNLPEDWLPPKTAAAYLMRVYDIKYLNENEGQWIGVVSDWLKESDALIDEHMEPINNLKQQIKDFQEQHTEAIRGLGTKKGTTNTATEIVPVSKEVGPGIKTYNAPSQQAIGNEQGLLEGSKELGISPEALSLKNMKDKLKSMQEKLQDRIRQDPDLLIHADDFNNLSAKEANELTGLLKPIKDAEKAIEEQQSVISKLKNEKSRQLSLAKSSKTQEKATPKAEKFVEIDKQIKDEESKLHELNDDLFLAQDELNNKAHKGELNPRFYKKDENIITFKNTNERLQFRKKYNSDKERERAAKGYYDSIMHMRPEDIVADVFGKITGKPSENPLKKRTLPVPDHILYNNNFMTKDLYSKTANYINYLSKRTHLKTSFENVTVNGGFEELAENLLEEHKSNRELINNRIKKLESEKGNNYQKEIDKEKKSLRKEKVDFEANKKDMKYLYETRMMGLNKRHDFDEMGRRTWMSLTAAANLHNLPATQVTDLAFGGFQHGIWPSVRDGIYPIIQSLGGILKTKDSQALREMAPHINLGYQDVLNNFADRNWSSELQPYINMGKIVSGVEKFAHFSALTDLSPYIDNGVQHAHGSVIQSRFMELLHKQVEGKLSEKESLYLRKYGINPKVWAEKMVAAYKDADGFKTKLGGYVSKAWQWQDLESANVFNDAVFRGIQNTLVWKGMADSPFFADNILGLFFHTFTGWGYAATNRYLIPSLQHPDAELLIKMLWMAGAGALVSPTRRISRGEDPWPDDMTPTQIAYEAFTDSGIFSTIGNVLNIANFLSDDKLLGELKNDKFKNRARTGIFGVSDVISSTATRISDVLGMANSGINEKDMKTAAHMLPITGAMYGHYLSDKLIESWDLPRNKKAAEMQ